MNRTAALDRDRAAPSSPASTANRMTATESLLPEIINDFFNKICHERTHAPHVRSPWRARKGSVEDQPTRHVLGARCRPQPPGQAWTCLPDTVEIDDVRKARTGDADCALWTPRGFKAQAWIGIRPVCAEMVVDIDKGAV